MAPASCHDTRKLVFGMPDANAFVSFTGPTGTLPPGTQVLVVNEGTGEVASFTADNDGAIAGSMLALIRHPATSRRACRPRTARPARERRGAEGSPRATEPGCGAEPHVSFERGEYRAPDGTTAVNSAGGLVEGDGGVELRLPPASVDDAVILQLRALAVSQLP